MLKITKDTLRRLNAVVGCLDNDTDDVFVGFVGRLNMSDRLYHGDVTFQSVGDTLPADSVSIKSILTDNGGVSDGDSQNQIGG